MVPVVTGYENYVPSLCKKSWVTFFCDLEFTSKVVTVIEGTCPQVNQSNCLPHSISSFQSCLLVYNIHDTVHLHVHALLHNNSNCNHANTIDTESMIRCCFTCCSFCWTCKAEVWALQWTYATWVEGNWEKQCFSNSLWNRMRLACIQC